MIIAEVSKIAENFALVRFSEPNEDFKSKPFNPIYGKDPMTEVNRQLYFLNRKYVSETIVKFLKQRFHAVRHHQTIIGLLLADIQMLNTAPLSNIVRFISNNATKIERVAPNGNSRYHKHYETIIAPILDWCHSETKLQRTT